MKLRDPFEREGEKLNLSALLVHAIISKLKGKKKLFKIFIILYKKFPLSMIITLSKKKGILEYSLSVSRHICNK